MVHNGNKKMLEINRQFDAIIEVDAEDGDFMLCIVTLEPPLDEH